MCLGNWAHFLFKQFYKLEINFKTMKALSKSPLRNIKWLKAGSKKALTILSGINRPIISSHVNPIAASISKIGIVRPIIVAELSFITGRLTKYIIDGQHLFTACLRNNIDIPYVVIPIKNPRELIEILAMLNASSKNWAMQDYVTAWASLIEDYVKLNEHQDTYDFEYSILADILSGGMAGSGGSVSKKIKRGEFRIIEEEENVEIVKQLTDILKIVPRMSRFENRYLCSEYVKFRRSTSAYNHQSFLKKVEKNKNKFVLVTQESGRLFEMFKKLK